MIKEKKVELIWNGKNNKSQNKTTLIKNDKNSFHFEEKSYKNNIFSNILINGNSVQVLKTLEENYSTKVKCIYIDPPYNTGNKFEYYNDGMQQSSWLSLMHNCLKSMYNLLSDNGFICCHIDDSQGHYLKILLDEVFGRNNYLTTFYIQVRYSKKTLKQDMDFHKQIEQIHIYRKSNNAHPNLPTVKSSLEKFNYYVTEKAKGKKTILGDKKVILFNKNEYEIIKGEGTKTGLKEIWASGIILDGNSSGRFFRDNISGRNEIDGLGCMYKVFGIGDDELPYRYFTGPKRKGATKGRYYQGVPLSMFKKVKTIPIENYYNLAASFGNCRHEGGVDFRSGKKPEKLLQILLNYFSNKGDLVLDSFGGSGTTAAVAHKMGRRWISIELLEQCLTHIIPRMKKVINGKDNTGVTKVVSWKGGGGYDFYTCDDK